MNSGTSCQFSQEAIFIRVCSQAVFLACKNMPWIVSTEAILIKGILLPVCVCVCVCVREREREREREKYKYTELLLLVHC